MIKATDLRIGNLLEVINKNTKISNIVEITASTILDISANGENSSFIYKPIPITEKILKKLAYEDWGVVKVNEFESYKRFVFYNICNGTSNHEVHKITSTYGNTNEIKYVTSIDKDERQYNRRMEFVHDLQNACYKEIGFELTFIK